MPNDNKTPLRVLILEDRPEDAELMLYELRQAGFQPKAHRVDTETDFQTRLAETPDIILADYSLPQYDARRALTYMQERGPDIPFIIVTGALSDEEAAACIKEGAADYLRKDRMARLGYAVSSVLERREMRKRVLTSEKMASIGRFAAGASHELNNPLACVIGFSEAALGWLTDQQLDRVKLKTALEKVIHHAGRCRGIVTSLLAYGRAFNLEQAPVQAHEVIEESIALVAHQTSLAHIQVMKSFTRDLPIIQANREALARGFVNLILNACQAMDGKGILTLTTRKHDPWVEIVFQDTGKGISAKHLHKIFDPFFSTREVGAGTGLGLSVCAGIIHAYGGEIKAASQGEGQGATFIIRLPIESNAECPVGAKHQGATCPR